MKKQLESKEISQCGSCSYGDKCTPECEHCFGYDETLDDDGDWTYSGWLKTLPIHERLKVQFRSWWSSLIRIRKVLFFAIIINILVIIITTFTGII